MGAPARAAVVLLLLAGGALGDRFETPSEARKGKRTVKRARATAEAVRPGFEFVAATDVPFRSECDAKRKEGDLPKGAVIRAVGDARVCAGQPRVQFEVLDAESGEFRPGDGWTSLASKKGKVLFTRQGELGAEEARLQAWRAEEDGFERQKAAAAAVVEGTERVERERQLKMEAAAQELLKAAATTGTLSPPEPADGAEAAEAAEAVALEAEAVRLRGEREAKLAEVRARTTERHRLEAEQTAGKRRQDEERKAKKREKFEKVEAEGRGSSYLDGILEQAGVDDHGAAGEQEHTQPTKEEVEDEENEAEFQAGKLEEEAVTRAWLEAEEMARVDSLAENAAAAAAAQEGAEEQPEEPQAPPPPVGRWQSVKDPSSGKTYYRHSGTQQTSLKMPAELLQQQEEREQACGGDSQRFSITAWVARQLDGEIWAARQATQGRASQRISKNLGKVVAPISKRLSLRPALSSIMESVHSLIGGGGGGAPADAQTGEPATEVTQEGGGATTVAGSDEMTRLGRSVFVVLLMLSIPLVLYLSVEKDAPISSSSSGIGIGAGGSKRPVMPPATPPSAEASSDERQSTARRAYEQADAARHTAGSPRLEMKARIPQQQHGGGGGGGGGGARLQPARKRNAGGGGGMFGGMCSSKPKEH